MNLDGLFCGGDPDSFFRPDNRPIKIYDSNGHMFELYEGGQPYRRTEPIRWEHMESLDGVELLPPRLYRRLERDDDRHSKP